MAVLRRFIFNILAVSDYRPTPPSLLKEVGEKYVWYRTIRFEVNLPVELQMVSRHKKLVSRLVEEFPQLSSLHGGINCTRGEDLDFVQEMREDRAGSLGHLWEHLAAQAFDDVSTQLGYGDKEFVWSSSGNWRPHNLDRSVYLIRCFHEEKPPAEFFGLENVVTGYLNALIEGHPFSFRERLKDFVEHRTVAVSTVAKLAS